MDIIKELQDYKRNLGFSNEEISEKTGVPLSTVQKIFGGVTKSPRRKTLLALESFFRKSYSYHTGNNVNVSASSVEEKALAYNTDSKVASGAEPDDASDWIIKRMPADDPEFPGAIKLIFLRQGTYTIDDLDRLPDGVRVELIDGVLYQFNNPTVTHQRIVLMLAKQLDDCAASHGCEVLISPLGVQLDCDEKTLVQPDVMAICDTDKALEEGIYGAPEFVAEVLSRSTRHRDLTIKLAKYEHAGVKEYWIIDPEHERVLVYDFNDENVIFQYTFDDKIPVRLSGGECIIDFPEIKERLDRLKH